MPIKDLLKDGTSHFSGKEETTLRNIEACKEFGQILRTSLGPNGMNKMVINHLEKLFVTNDAATIMNELDIYHPAAKMIVMAAKQMQNEVGDNTNLVVIFASELLQHAESLIMMDLHISDIISGYSRAGDKVLEFLNDAVVNTVSDIRSVSEVSKALKCAIAAKQYGWEDFLAPLVAEACISILPHDDPKKFSVDNVRVCKVIGGGVGDTTVFKGFAVPKDAAGTIKHVEKAKILVLQGGLEPPQSETKRTVLLTDADELLGFSKGEEEQMHTYIKEIADAGVNVIVSGGHVDDMALHFCEKYKIMVIRENSKFNLRRICNTTGAIARVTLAKVIPEEVGTADSVTVEEVGSTNVVFFYNSSERCKISTLVVRGSTMNIMDDIERSIEDAINTFKCLIRDPRLVAGAGACEMELAKKLSKVASETPGLEQYALAKYAEAFEIIPRTLAENVGLPPMEIVTTLKASHEQGNSNDGIDVEDMGIKSAVDMGIFDTLLGKWWALRLATDTAVDILRVDQMIMAKRAGGPEVPKMGPRDMD